MKSFEAGFVVVLGVGLAVGLAGCFPPGRDWGGDGVDVGRSSGGEGGWESDEGGEGVSEAPEIPVQVRGPGPNDRPRSEVSPGFGGGSPCPPGRRCPGPRVKVIPAGIESGRVSSGFKTYGGATLWESRLPKNETGSGWEGLDPSVSVYGKPWRASCRIRVKGEQGFTIGSGTVIGGEAGNSIILTCAHLFSRGVSPESFAGKITVDLCTGDPDPKTQVISFEGSVPGECVAFDRSMDVGLVRTRQGYEIDSAELSQKTPLEGDTLVAVGCGDGADAIVWETEAIRMVNSDEGYEGIVCKVQPKQGRSGGGLFYPSGKVVGVCNFAYKDHDIGVYAGPNSIHKLLVETKLDSLYGVGKKKPDEPSPGDGRQAHRRGRRGGSDPKGDDFDGESGPLPNVPSLSVHPLSLWFWVSALALVSVAVALVAVAVFSVVFVTRSILARSPSRGGRRTRSSSAYLISGQEERAESLVELLRQEIEDKDRHEKSKELLERLAKTLRESRTDPKAAA